MSPNGMMGRARVRSASLIASAILAAALCFAVHGSARAQTDDEQARGHFETGSAHYQQGRFQEAAQEFELAYQLSHRPGLLHNIYLARRDMGDYAGAAQALRGYLDQATDIPADQRTMLEARLENLQRQAGSSGMGIIPGAVVLGIGGAVLIVSLIESIVATSIRDQYEAICSQDADPDTCPGSEAARLDGLVSDFELHRGLGWGFFIGGLAVAGVGAVLLGVGLADESGGEAPPAEAPVAFGFGCDATGCVGHLRGSF